MTKSELLKAMKEYSGSIYHTVCDVIEANLEDEDIEKILWDIKNDIENLSEHLTGMEINIMNRKGD